jgi:hypothetical protein
MTRVTYEDGYRSVSEAVKSFREYADREYLFTRLYPNRERGEDAAIEVIPKWDETPVTVYVSKRSFALHRDGMLLSEHRYASIAVAALVRLFESK